MTLQVFYKRMKLLKFSQLIQENELRN